ncbi:MAG TPA: BTAD domain-containing putative transcriptional regulator [Thermomonospora sp.]|nr:BTAD domain-containing putative transcriptional regulator [Thermomonospora sp.]
MGTRTPEGLGAEVRRRREAAGLTQRELADKAGLSLRAVRGIERGEVHRPRDDTVRRLAEVLGGELRRWREVTVRVDVLGPLTVRRGGNPVEIGPPLRRTLLVLLAVQPGRPVGQDEVVDVLWDGSPPKTHRSLIHSHIAALRRLLRPDGGTAPSIDRTPMGYVLQAGERQLDLAEFDAGTSRDAPLETVETALDLWRGPVAEDLPGRLRSHPPVVAVAQRRIAAVLAYADRALALGLYANAVARLRPVAPLEPLHETLQARLMLALAGDGQQAAALDLYAALRERLAAELGVEPGAVVREAHLRVLREEAPGRAVPAQLPGDVVGFCGRAAALRELDAVAAATVVVSGGPGVGKSALTVHWAHGARRRFPDGQLYADLRGHSPRGPARPLEILIGFLDALGVPVERIPAAQDAAAALFRTMAAGRRLLVVLDDAVDAAQVRPLLPGEPGCLVLVTSRDRLAGLVAREGAHRVALGPLPPGEATELLRHVAGPGDAADAARVAELCGHLPLALRIAGERAVSRRLSPARLAEEIADERDRLDLLAVEGDESTAVRTVFSWSYRALPGPVAEMFRLLGLGPGRDLSLPAVAALTGITVSLARSRLSALTARNLVEEHREGRYRLHDLLRLYAAERAGEDAEAGTAVPRLLAWYLGGVEEAQRVLTPHGVRVPVEPIEGTGPGPVFSEPAQALGWCAEERANLVAAVLHAAESGQDAIAWRLALGLWPLFHLKGHPEDWITTHHSGLEAVRRCGDRTGEAWLSTSLAYAWRSARRPLRARAWMAAAVALWRGLGDRYGEAVAVSGLADLDRERGETAAALDHGERAVAAFADAGSRWGEGIALTGLGLACTDLGRLQEALTRYREALAAFEEIGDRFGVGETLAGLANLHVRLGRSDEALRHCLGSIEAAREVGDQATEGRALWALGDLHRAAGRPAQAERAWREALPLLHRFGGPTAAEIHERLGS